MGLLSSVLLEDTAVSTMISKLDKGFEKIIDNVLNLRNQLIEGIGLKNILNDVIEGDNALSQMNSILKNTGESMLA